MKQRETKLREEITLAKKEYELLFRKN